MLWLVWILLLLVPATVLAAGNEPVSTLPVDPANQPTSDYFQDERSFLNQEDAARYRRMFPEAVLAGGYHPAAGAMISAPLAAEAFDRDGFRVSQQATAIDYSLMGCGADDTAWVIMSSQTSDTMANFHRVVGTDYFVDCTSATRPTLPTASAWLMQVPIVASAVGAPRDLASRLITAAQPYTVTTNITVDAQATWQIPPGGMVTVASGVTLTMETCPQAGRWQIFDADGVTTGRVAMLGCAASYPEWHGVVMDGVTSAGQAVRMNAALAAAGATSMVSIAPGTMMLDAGIHPVDGTTIRGAGRYVSTLKFADVENATFMVEQEDPAIAVARVSIADVTLDCNRALNGANTGIVGLRLHKVSDSTLLNSRITGCSQHAILLAEETSDNNTIVGNQIDDYGTGSVGFCIGIFRGPDRNRVIGNTCESTQTNVGVAIDDWSSSGESADSQMNLVLGNTFSGMDFGVIIQGTTLNTVTGNIFTDVVEGIVINDGDTGTNLRTPVTAMYNTVTGNIITAATTRALRDDGWHTAVSGNIFRATPVGIEKATQSVGSVYTGNVITEVSTNCVQFSAGRRLVLTGNTCVDAGAAGLVFSDATGAFTQNLIANNMVYDTGNAGILVTDTGTGVGSVMVAGNMVMAASTATPGAEPGIDFVGTIVSSRIQNNTIDPSGVLRLVRVPVGANIYVEGNRDLTGAGNDIPIVSVNDATPSMNQSEIWRTANTSATTITYLDDMIAGKPVTIFFEDTSTTIDFTGTDLFGNGGVDFVPAGNVDFMTCRKRHNGTTIVCDVTDN